jgi:hypothetical protein
LQVPELRLAPTALAEQFPAMGSVRACGEEEVRVAGRAETRFRFSTGVTTAATTPPADQAHLAAR